jgi:hypothetical protein
VFGSYWHQGGGGVKGDSLTLAAVQAAVVQIRRGGAGTAGQGFAGGIVVAVLVASARLVVVLVRLVLTAVSGSTEVLVAQAFRRLLTCCNYSWRWRRWQ